MSQEIKTNDDSRHTVSKLHKEKIFRTVLVTNTRKEIKHDTTEKSSKNFKYQLLR